MNLIIATTIFSIYLAIGAVLTYRRGNDAIAMVSHEHPLLALCMLLSSWLFWPLGRYASAPAIPFLFLADYWGRFYHFSWLHRRLMDLKSRYLAWQYRRKYGELPLDRIKDLDINAYYPCNKTKFPK